jgi:uncharacterized protein YaaN involved in tellurite resistance
MANELVPSSNPGAGQVDAATAQFGLAAPSPEKVNELAARLESGSLQAVHMFGRELGTHTARHTDMLLEQVKSRDLDQMGAKLSEIVSAARSLNLGPLSDRRSKVPLLGSLIDKVKLKGEVVLTQFQDVRTQVDRLVGEVQAMQGGLSQRVEQLEGAFESVKQEHALLGAHIAAGTMALQRLNSRLETEGAGAATDPMKAQETQDLRSAVAALGKRVDDMRVLQHAALQQLPMIRMVQANNRMLIEKFHNIKELTVPAWKRQFMLALSLNEQKNAVQLANHIDDATNAFMLENARLLKDNSVSTAKANQRMVIDVQTLEQVHESLMSTVQEVVRINQEGIQQRSAAGARLQVLRQQMAQQGALG